MAGPVEAEEISNVCMSDSNNAYHILWRSEQQQRMEGDCRPAGYVSNLPRRVHLEVKCSDTTDLQKYLCMLPNANQESFREKYGHIADLLSIEIQDSAIKELIQYWDPTYHCFTLQDVDTVPTIEEYAQLLNMKFKVDDKVFFPPDADIQHRKLRRIIGEVESAENLKNRMVTQGSVEGWYWTYIRGFFHQNFKREKFVFCEMILALAIYGLVLFPSAGAFIDKRVVDIFEDVQWRRINPIPAILAETLLSLNYCREKGKGTLKCCHQLLYIWLMNHMFTWKRISWTWLETMRPILEFKREEWPIYTKEQWVDAFIALCTENYHWRAAWYRPGRIVFRGAHLPWVPLVGLKGCIGYSPALVMRQFGFRQFIPRTIGLNDMYFFYKYGPESDADRQEQVEKIKGVKKAWKGVICSSGILHGKRTTAGYPRWQMNKGMDYRIPNPTGPNRPSSSTSNSVIDHEAEYKAWSEFSLDMKDDKIDTLIGQKRSLEEQNTQLIDQNRKLQKHNDNLQSQLEQTNEDKERLQEAERQVAELQGENNIIGQENVDLRMEVERLEERLRALEGRQNV